MRILITGGAGFIGSNLAVKLSKKHEISIVDNLSSGTTSNIEGMEDFVFFDRDLRIDSPEIECDFVYHSAAHPSVATSYGNPAFDFQENVVSTFNALEIARRNECPFVFFSSCTVYGNINRKKLSENLPLNPISIYGCSKLCGEEYTRAYHSIYGIPTISLRLFNVYGPNSRQGVMYDFFNKLKEKPTLDVLGSGNQVRDFICIDDVIGLLGSLLKKKSALDGSAYNIGTGRGSRIIDIAELMRDTLAPGKKIRIMGGKAWRGDMEHAVADITRAASILKFQPAVKLEEGIKRYILWLEKGL